MNELEKQVWLVCHCTIQGIIKYHEAFFFFKRMVILLKMSISYLVSLTIGHEFYFDFSDRLKEVNFLYQFDSLLFNHTD